MRQKAAGSHIERDSGRLDPLRAACCGAEDTGKLDIAEQGKADRDIVFHVQGHIGGLVDNNHKVGGLHQGNAQGEARRLHQTHGLQARDSCGDGMGKGRRFCSREAHLAIGVHRGCVYV